MKFLYNIQHTLFIFSLFLLLQACGGGATSGSGREDNTAGTVTLTSHNSGEEIIGTTNITWDNDEPNRSYVDIEFSNDSGTTYQIIENNIPDTGNYNWDTNTVKDCRKCRIRVTASDVVGNVSDAVESNQDFIINNVPQVLGIAYYTDKNGDGLPSDDTIIVPFDKKVNLLTSIASDVFEFPVLEDSIGSFAEIFVSKSNAKELIIKMNDIGIANYHLHIGGRFDTTKLNRTAPSGINLRKDISPGVIFAPDTGRTATVAESGIDILPTFSESQAINNNPTAIRTTSVALGDIDSDGDLDIVEGNNGANTIWLNDGVGTYTEDVSLGSSNTHSIALGDIDGDGDLDMVTANHSSSNKVWFNQGGIQAGSEGTFIDSGQNLGFGYHYSILLADVNKNGHLDVVIGTTGTASKIWLNNGTGTFTDSLQELGPDDSTRSIAVGDIDNDGDLDLVTGNNNQLSKVWLNNGSGTFTEDLNQSLESYRTYSVVLGDIDGDNDLDLILGNWAKESNIVYFNDGSGRFSKDTSQNLGTDYTETISLVDFDEDGDLDLIEGNTGNSIVWLNDGKGKFTKIDSGITGVRSSAFSYIISAAKNLVIGDVDGDGDKDIVSAGDTLPSKIWKNSLRHYNSFMQLSPQPIGDLNTQAITLGDIDNDGDLDIVKGNYLNTNKVLLNNNTGIFKEHEIQSTGTIYQTHSIELGDIDSDGDLDMVEGNFGQPNKIWFNNASGTFTEDSSQALGSTKHTNKIRLGDLDGDGDLDIVTANGFGTTSQPNSVFFNNGNGNFTESEQLGNNVTFSLTLADVDGDSDLDIIFGNSGLNQIWLNQGGIQNGIKGKFLEDLSQSLGGYNTYSIISSDVDGDGDIDFVDGNYNSANRVWLNDGTGQFTVTTQQLGTNKTNSIALVDIDNDGDPDIVEGNTTGQANKIWINNNKGMFYENLQILGDSYTESIALGDIDGDGDLDLVEGNGSQPSLIWLNDY